MWRLTLISAQVTSGDFTVVNGCGNSLNEHSSCALSVAFAPKSVGDGRRACSRCRTNFVRRLWP